jgi:hypothetical protein
MAYRSHLEAKGVGAMSGFTSQPQMTIGSTVTGGLAAATGRAVSVTCDRADIAMILSYMATHFPDVVLAVAEAVRTADELAGPKQQGRDWGRGNGDGYRLGNARDRSIRDAARWALNALPASGDGSG